MSSNNGGRFTFFKLLLRKDHLHDSLPAMTELAGHTGEEALPRRSVYLEFFWPGEVTLEQFHETSGPTNTECISASTIGSGRPDCIPSYAVKEI